MTFTLGIPVIGFCGLCGAELPERIISADEAKHYEHEDGTYSESGMCKACLHKAAVNNGSIEPKWG